MLLKLGSKCRSDGSIQALKFIHGFQRLVLYSTSTEEADSCFPNYLVNSLGFSKQQSLSISSKISHPWRKARIRKFKLNFTSKAVSVLDFLQKQGFDRPHIRKLVFYHPQILLNRVDQTLKPKFELLQNLGLSGSDLVRVIMKNPILLVRNFGPVITAYRSVLGSDDAVVTVISSSHWSVISGFYVEDVTANFTLLENSYGIPTDIIRKHMIRSPRIFSMRIGSFSKLLSRTQSDIMALVQQNPVVLTSSVARLKKSLGVIMNELGFDAAYLAKRSFFFTYSTERRTIPRYRVLVALKEKGLIRKDFHLVNVICLNESMFLDKFVVPFKEVHEVYPNFVGSSVKLIA